jgi:hypothetical protein
MLAVCSRHGRTCERNPDKQRRCEPPVRLQGLLFSHHEVLGRHAARQVGGIPEYLTSPKMTTGRLPPSAP